MDVTGGETPIRVSPGAGAFPFSASDPLARPSSFKGPHQPWAGAPRVSAYHSLPAGSCPPVPTLGLHGLKFRSLGSAGLLCSLTSALAVPLLPPLEAGGRSEAEEVCLASHATSPPPLWQPPLE